MRAWAAGLRASGARFALRRARPSRSSSGHFKGDLGAAPRGPPHLPRPRLMCAFRLSHLHRHECRCDMDEATCRHLRTLIPGIEVIGPDARNSLYAGFVM